MKTQSKAIEPIIWMFVGLFLIILIWLPFGFSLGGLIEEWDELGFFAKQGPIFYIDSTSIVAPLRGRPLTFLPQSIAYLLDSNSFFYWHILLIGSLLIKFLTSCYIGRFMTKSIAGGLLVGTLALLFPADTMQINLRSMHINFAIALAIAGATIVLLAQEVTRSWLRVGLGLVAAGLFVTGCLIYETVLSLTLIPFVALYVRYGPKIVFRRAIGRLDVWLLWAAAFGGCVAFIAVVSQQSDSYQGSLVGQPGGLFSRFSHLAQTIVFTALYRGFVEAWTDSYLLAWTQLSHGGAFLMLVVGLAIGWYLLVDYEERTSLRSWTSEIPVGRLFVGGLVLFVAGYAPFLLSAPHVLVTQRTFLEAATGGSMVVAAIIITSGVVLRNRIWSVVIAVPIVAAGLLSQIYQHDQFNRIYAEAGRPMVKALATIADQFRAGERIAIVSKYGYLTGAWDFGIPTPMLLAYLKPDRGDVTLCDGRTGQPLPLSRPLSDTTCRVDTDGLNITTKGGGRTVYPRFAVIETDGAVTMHDSGTDPSVKLAPPKVPPILNLGHWTVADSWFNRRPPGLVYECNFESDWGYSIPCRTYGMYAGQFAGLSLRPSPRSFSWVNDEHAGLMISTLKSNTSYRVIIDLQDFQVSPDLGQVRLTFNDTPIKLEWPSPRRIEGDIPSELVTDRVNVLGIQAPLDKQYHLSLGLQHVRIFAEPR